MTDVIGTATQLPLVILSLIELSQTVYGATSTLKKYDILLEQLRSILESIRLDPHLQNTEMQKATDHLFSIIEKAKAGLKSIITKPKYKQVVYLLWRRKALSETFVDLERQKACLGLIINKIQAQDLQEIKRHVEPSNSKNRTTGDVGSSFKAVISGNFAGPNVVQHNGPLLEVDSDQLRVLSDTTLYTNNTASGGHQHNGPKIKLIADKPINIDLAHLSGTHMNARAVIGGNETNLGPLGIQHNGPKVAQSYSRYR